MYRINLVVVGKVKEKYFADAVKEYEKRLSRFCEFKIYECKECGGEDSAPEVALKKESEEILKKLGGYVFVMAIEGKQCDSAAFSEKLLKIKDTVGEATFVIGSSYGISDSVKAKADELISFSKMTFPHTLFRVMLTEQIYRAFMIGGGGKYHK